MHRLNNSRQRVLDQINRLRCLERTISSKLLLNHYEQSSDKSRLEVLGYIDNLDEKKIQIWLNKKEAKTDLAELPVRKLRKLASVLNIKDYHLLTKALLLVELQKEQ